MARPCKLYLLTGIDDADAVQVQNLDAVRDGSLLFLSSDSRKITGYTLDGEISFVDIDVRRDKGQLIDLDSLPNVGSNIEAIGLLSDSPITAIEVTAHVESNPTFLFVREPLSDANAVVGFTDVDMSPLMVSATVNDINRDIEGPRSQQSSESHATLEPGVFKP